MTPSIVATSGLEKSPERDEKIWDVSRQFEAVFVNKLIGAMRSTVVKGGYVPESHAERVYQGMLDQEYAGSIAATDQLGLARVIYQQLLRTQNGG